MAELRVRADHFPGPLRSADAAANANVRLQITPTYVRPGFKSKMDRIRGHKNARKRGKKIEKLISLAMECMGVAITIIDTNGTLLYYNKQAAKILDRKPEYIGKDVHSHHKMATSNKKVDLMLQDFQKGRTEPFNYEAKPYGKTILVTLSPNFRGWQIYRLHTICEA
ncbi:MAG: PAS domain-containing protein [Desulfobacteraceae bacterium]|nr:PAS domain-containing protein [Desulfobacteraceae bacterium]